MQARLPWIARDVARIIRRLGTLFHGSEIASTTVLGMALGFEDILAHPGLPTTMREQSRTLVDLHDSAPRLAAAFATQQRWLLAHIALSIHYRSVAQGAAPGVILARYLDIAERHGVASRNTADAFAKEILAYGYAHHVDGGGDRRRRPIVFAEPSLAIVSAWLATHLATLDALDNGMRLKRFTENETSIAVMQPLIADALLATPAVREPPSTFSLFTWLNNGGVVMDWLVAGMEDLPLDTERVPTSVASTVEMAARCRLSRTHLARKLREAETLGSIGWQGMRGRSRMWVSRAFRLEYASAQAVKLAIINAAFEAAAAR